MDELTIGEVARRPGLRPSALRYYESVGRLPPPRRRQTRRYYEPGVLRQLAVIAVAQQAGFTVAEIGTLLHGFESEIAPSARWRALAEQKLPEVEALIVRAQAMKRVLEDGLNCQCVDFESCLVVTGQGFMTERAQGPQPERAGVCAGDLVDKRAG